MDWNRQASIVMKKLPEEVRRIVLRSHDETKWTLADLRKKLGAGVSMTKFNNQE